MATLVTGAFPYRLSPLNSITPFTYRDGTTYQELLEQLRVYVNDSMRPEFNTEMSRIIDDFQAGITNAETRIIATETEYDELLADARAYVDASVQFINNKTGPSAIVRTTLTGPYTMTIDPLWPNNHPVYIVLTQDGTGGHVVTWDAGDINGSVPVATAPNAATGFWLVPEGDGSWTPVQYASRTELTEGLAIKANAASVTASLALKADKDVTVPLVTTYAQLAAAVAAGGTIHVGNNPITITGEIAVTAPTRIIGGHFVLPLDAGYPAFKVTSSYVKFDKCTFLGAGTANTRTDTARFIDAAGTVGNYLRSVTVTGCRMGGNQSDNIRYQYVRDSSITDNIIADFLYSGIMLLSSEDVTVSGNTVSNAVMKAPVVNVYGIAATDITNETATRSRNIKIIGNTIENIPWEGIDTHGGENIIITGNTITSCARGIALVVGNETRLTSPKNCVVSGNIVDKGTDPSTDRSGIGLFGLSSNFATAVITGNIVRGYTDDQAIYLTQYDVRKTLVEGNSHPHIKWTPINMDNGTQWIGHDTFTPEYMVDGRNVYTRGMVTPVGTQTTAAQRLGGVPSVARPGKLTMFRATRGANSASSTNATIAANPDGALEMYYRNNTNDFYSYPIDGTYQRDYTGAL